MKLTIPELSLVVLISPSGAGKSSFARKHFKVTEVLSSDFCRGLVSDDENSQEATNDAFEVLHFVAAKRLTAENWSSSMRPTYSLRRATVVYGHTPVTVKAALLSLAISRFWLSLLLLSVEICCRSKSTYPFLFY